MTPKTPRQLERLDNKRTREQTGLTAGPGSVGEAVETTRPRRGGEGGREGERGEGGGESLHITDTQDFSLRREIGGIETAPYSRSSSSYNSLYLPLLNLKEKTGI